MCIRDSYWITAIDASGAFQGSSAKLVGVIGDDVVRQGVRVVMAPTRN